MLRPIALSLGVMMLSHCSAPVSVRMEKPVAPVGAPAARADINHQLSSIREAHDRIRRGDTSAIPIYNYSVALELIDPYQVETVSLAGKSHPLAADYDAAVMLGLSKARIDKLGLARLLRPSRYDDTVHLNFLQPYDPKRIPVLMVHGLDSTPATRRCPLLLHLRCLCCLL